MAVHMRTLYLLLRLLSKSSIDKEAKRTYIKVVRGQLSDAELIAIRYNSLTPLGENMKQYILEFNLLKHSPIMDYLEYKEFRLILNDSSLIESINAEFIRVRSILSSLLNTELTEDWENTVFLSQRYSLKIEISHKKESIKATLVKVVPLTIGGGTIKPKVEKALDIFDEVLLDKLFFFYFQEIFKIARYDDSVKVTKPARRNNHKMVDGKETIDLVYYISSSEPLKV